jgi:tight adherence protein B
VNVVTALLVLVAAALFVGPSSSARLRWVTARDAVPARTAAPSTSRPLLGRRRPRPPVRALAEQWAAGLRAGLGAAAALAEALTIDGADTGSVHFARTRTAVATAGDVGAALRADADHFPAPERAAVRSLAACWDVGRGSGGGLAAAVERVADSVRADELHRGHVRSELAGPHASARLLAVLPLLVLGLSSGLGLATPREVLSTPAALLALVAGLLLDAVGLWWTVRLTRGAERAP